MTKKIFIDADLRYALNSVPPELEKFFIPLRAGKKCPNCGGEKKDGQLTCRRCLKAERELEEQLEKGITLEYADGSKETITSRKSRTSRK